MLITPQTENQILEIYKKNLDLRIFLLNTDFNVLRYQDIIDQSIIDFSDREKSDYQVFIQLSIIAKMMMLIEDFAVLSLSFIKKKNFYDLLQTEKDLGKTIGKFIRSLPYLRYSDVLKIMSWTDSKGQNNGVSKIIKKYIRDNVAIIQKKFDVISLFSNYHHPSFKRFKHGGIPIFPVFKYEYKWYKSLALVSEGESFFYDLSLIPHHDSVFTRYDDLIKGIKSILVEMIENKQRCNLYQIPGVYPKLNPEVQPSEEVTDIIREHTKKYPLNIPASTPYDRLRIDELISSISKFYD